MRKNKTYFLIFFLILFISIGFAYLSTTLGINGFANVKGNKWEIYFSNFQKIKGDNLVSVDPVIEGKTTKDISYQVTLGLPGDVYKFNVDVVNDGTIDAMIDIVSKTNLSDEQKEFIDYTVTYLDEGALTSKDSLRHGERETLTVTVQFKKDITEEELATINEQQVNVDMSIRYLQADNTAVERTKGKLKVSYDWNYNFVKNGDFTDGLNGWELTVSSDMLSATIDNEMTYNGKPSVHIYDNGQTSFGGIIYGGLDYSYRYPSGHSYYFKSCIYQDSNDSLGGVNQGVRSYIAYSTDSSVWNHIGIATGAVTNCKSYQKTNYVFETLPQKKWTCYENICSLPSYAGNENYVNRAFRVDSSNDRVTNNYWLADNQMRIIDSEEFNYDDTLSKLPTPEREGYSFDGWYTDPYGGTKIEVGQHVTESTTYYAHWN